MLYEDKHGRLWMPEEIEKFSETKIDELEIHVYEENYNPLLSYLKGCVDCEMPNNTWRKIFGGSGDLIV